MGTAAGGVWKATLRPCPLSELRSPELQPSRLRHGCLRRGGGERGILALFPLAVLLLTLSGVQPAPVTAQERKDALVTGGTYRPPLGPHPQPPAPARIIDLSSPS